jgi:adenosylhomocysteine nucleosidase
MKLLMVASDRMEFRGILARAEESHAVDLPLDWARLVRLGGNELLLAANGVGWKRAAEAVERACAWFRPERVVSTGFCGALDPGLPVCGLVSASSVAAPGRRYEALPLAGGVIGQTGVLYSVPHVVRTREEKYKLYSEGGIAVEMEAAAVAAEAEKRALPFHCVRAVTDLAGETMANDFEAALRADGHFDTMSILRATLRQPMVRLPELLRLQSRCARAARVLGEFFADCRF